MGVVVTSPAWTQQEHADRLNQFFNSFNLPPKAEPLSPATKCPHPQPVYPLSSVLQDLDMAAAAHLFPQLLRTAPPFSTWRWPLGLFSSSSPPLLPFSSSLLAAVHNKEKEKENRDAVKRFVDVSTMCQEHCGQRFGPNANSKSNYYYIYIYITQLAIGKLTFHACFLSWNKKEKSRRRCEQYQKSCKASRVKTRRLNILEKNYGEH